MIFLLAACDSSQSTGYKPEYGMQPSKEIPHYIIGVHPLHNPQRLHEVFGPVADLLNKQINGVDFEIEASRNYAAFDEKLYSGKFQFALPNPYQTLLSLKHNYRVFGKMGDDDNFRGIILVRKDSGINKVTDLKGKSVSFPAPTALAATMMPQYYLQENGLDVNKDIEIKYVGSQESSIMNVLFGDAAAGATWPPPWRILSQERPQLIDELEIKWETKPLLNNGLVVRNDVPQNIVDQVSVILFNLHKNEAGKTILDRMELSQFEPASDETYQPIKDFLGKFNLKVRKIEH
ncbi:phosphate/phosphite/phosphonate ABC transporter substrate-binding protein [bacterium]|nr:phosphate/phosphite/phosphonate ABC transporter substrate-binding protein [bacterium]